MDTTRTSAPGRNVPRAPAARIGSLADLHAGPVLDVAVLGAAVLAGLHPAFATRVDDDPRHPWQQVLDTARIVRASGVDPCRALALAARERALTGVRTDPTDPEESALLHALRVHLVLRTATAVGLAPDRRTAERYVRDQQGAAVLMGAEPDDLPANLDEVRLRVGQVREHAETVRAGDRLPPPVLCRVLDPRVPEWAAATRLVPSVLPGWARAHLGPGAAGVLDAAELERSLHRLHAAGGLGLSPARR